MDFKLSFFNFSLNKLLITESDSFARAKLKILFTILGFSILKVLIALTVSWQFGQFFQFGRGIVMLLAFGGLFKLLLTDKKYATPATHIVICISLLLEWSNVFVTVQGINLITLQFVFMIILSSFYLLEKYYGVFYAFLSTTPVIITVLGGQDLFPSRIKDAELASPGYEIIVILNFITIIISHYIYHQAFRINIKEKEDLNSQLRVAIAEATQAAQSKSDFLSTMSHELRTPLNSVIGMSELLLDDPHSEEQAENLRILNFSAGNLQSLVSDILDFNKLDVDKLHLEAINVDLHDLITNICSGLRFQAKEKGLSLVLDIDGAIEGHHFITDPTRISQMVYNLVGNAIKFTSEGSVTVSLKVLASNEHEMNVRFAISDTGIGISAEEQREIFEPFVQASSSTSRTHGGTGLGLAIVKRLMKLFNSDIQLFSTPGKGSRFSFDLQLPVEKYVVTPGASTATLARDLGHLKVLVAEDNSMNRLLLKKIFLKWNNEPVFVTDGQDVVDKVSAEFYDVILMDIHMPLLNGYEATVAIRSLPDPLKSQIPIIALTASVSEGLQEKIKAVGMDDYIYKPFNSKELYKKLKAIPVMKNTEQALLKNDVA